MLFVFQKFDEKAVQKPEKKGATDYHKNNGEWGLGGRVGNALRTWGAKFLWGENEANR